MIESSALSICQFIKSPVPGDSVHLLTLFCLACFDIARLTVIVKGINSLAAGCRHGLGVTLMHFDCIFMRQECTIKEK